METYWTFKYNIHLRGEDEHLLRLYHYTEKSIALITTINFGKAFAKEFKELNGRFNPRLNINNNIESGWIFRADNKTQENLNKLLRDIYTGDKKPEFSGVIEPIFNEKTRNNKIVNMLTNVMDMVPDSIEEYEISNKGGVITTLYFNADDTIITQGECIYSIYTAHKKLEIYQLQK
jgi:hypothetical protein